MVKWCLWHLLYKVRHLSDISVSCSICWDNNNNKRCWNYRLCFVVLQTVTNLKSMMSQCLISRRLNLQIRGELKFVIFVMFSKILLKNFVAELLLVIVGIPNMDCKYTVSSSIYILSVIQGYFKTPARYQSAKRHLVSPTMI